MNKHTKYIGLILYRNCGSFSVRDLKTFYEHQDGVAWLLAEDMTKLKGQDAILLEIVSCRGGPLRADEKLDAFLASLNAEERQEIRAEYDI